MATPIDSSAKRTKLETRRNPYWAGVSGGRGGVSLGYRKSARGPGAWVAKVVIKGTRIEERIGEADDSGASSACLAYRAAVAAALTWSKEQHAGIEARVGVERAEKAITVRTAVEEYSCARVARSKSAGRNAEGRLRKYVLSNAALADLHLSKLRSSHLDEWRRDLPAAFAPASVNRLLSDLRAALNAAAEKHRRQLPAHLPAEIKSGTKAHTLSNVARKQILDDALVRRIVGAAFDVDESGDFGRLVLLAAATGARHSQLARAAVGSVQLERGRILMPASAKGRGAKAKPDIAVPLSPEVMERLAPAIADRPENEPLLTCWAYKRAGAGRWARVGRRPWGAADEVLKFWSLAIARAGAPAGTVPYALRHSSIVRSLRAGLPIRLAAALHDTSSEMVEAHYAAHIVDATEELSRRAVMHLSAIPAAIE